MASSHCLSEADRIALFKSMGLPEESKLGVRINLGCGYDYIDGYINIDGDPSIKADVHMNIDDTDLRLPYENRSVDFIFASHIFEHIFYFPQLKQELIRILKPSGHIVIIVPHYLSMDAWGDDTHIRAFSEHSFMPMYWDRAEYCKFIIIPVKDGMGNQNNWIAAIYKKKAGGDVNI